VCTPMCWAKPVLVPRGEATGWAPLSSRSWRRHISDGRGAQDALCLSYRTVDPDPAAAEIYDRLLYALQKTILRIRGWRDPAGTAAHRGRVEKPGDTSVTGSSSVGRDGIGRMCA